MTMPTPPAPDAGQLTAPAAPAPAPPAQAPTPPPAPAPQNPAATVAQPPQAPPVPQPPTWTPPQPAEPADDGEDLSRLPKKWQDEIRRLREESAKYRTSARAERVRLHAYTTAAELGVNPAALLGSVAFAEAARALDPSAEDFPARLADTVQRVLKANPWMAAQPTPAPPPPPVPASGGADFQGAGGTPPPSLDEQIAEAEKAGNYALAISLKRQRAYRT